MKINLVHGNCLKKLKDMEDASVDAVVTDPPAGIAFMGKEWDSDKGGRDQWIAWLQEIMEECCRVLKHGAHVVVWALPRTSHWTRMAVDNAGFEIRHIIDHVYASGFPKSLNVGAAYDKICGESGRKEKFTKWMRTTNLSASEINKITGTFMGSHYLTTKEQPAIPTAELWMKLRIHIKIEIPKWVDELVERIEKEREVIGKTNTNLTVYQKIGQDNISGEIDVTKGTSQWEGWGSALKPAHEDWILARKPLSEKSIVENCIKHGTGALDIDSTRIPVIIDDPNHRKNDTVCGGFQNRYVNGTQKGNLTRHHGLAQGRFPADVIVSDGALDDGEVTKGKAGMTKHSSGSNKIYGEHKNSEKSYIKDGISDSGSKSRYFDLDVWSEKNGIFYCPKPGSQERGEDNEHSTVKPLALMSWLITLVSKPGDTVLDPFLGSGTTGIAAKKLNRNFIGIELDQNYFEIAKKRIKEAKKIQKQVNILEYSQDAYE